MRVRIAPSILTADFGRLAAEIAAAEEGGADLIHLDVMDGRFVPAITFGPLVVAAVRRATTLPLEAHLMVARPRPQLAPMAEAGCGRLIPHLEAAADEAGGAMGLVEASSGARRASPSRRARPWRRWRRSWARSTA